MKWPSGGLIYAAALAGLIGAPALAFADASLYLSPESASYARGDTFEVRLLADTDGALISAAEAELSYDAGAFAIEGISTEGSILNVWLTKPDFDGSTIRFSGVTKSPYSGSNGLLVTITFRALRNMLGNVRFTSGALLSYGAESTNVISTMRSGVYRVRPEEVLPEPIATSSELGVDDGTGSGGEVLGAATEGEGVRKDSKYTSAAAAAKPSRMRDILIFAALTMTAGGTIFFLLRRRSQ